MDKLILEFVIWTKEVDPYEFNDNYDSINDTVNELRDIEKSKPFIVNFLQEFIDDDNLPEDIAIAQQLLIKFQNI